MGEGVSGSDPVDGEGVGAGGVTPSPGLPPPPAESLPVRPVWGGHAAASRAAYGVMPGAGSDPGAPVPAGGVLPEPVSGYGVVPASVVPGGVPGAGALGAAGSGVSAGSAMGYGYVVPGAPSTVGSGSPAPVPDAPVGSVGLAASARVGAGRAFPSALDVPAEWWERVVLAWQGWWARHASFARWMVRLHRVVSTAALVLGVIAVVLVPRLALGLVPALFMIGCLVVMGLLARTRTVGLGAVLLLMSIWSGWCFSDRGIFSSPF